MIWGGLLGITIIIILMTLFEWPKMNFMTIKEKAAFIGVSAIGYVFAVILIIIPDLPSPSEILDAICNPINPVRRILEK